MKKTGRYSILISIFLVSVVAVIVIISRIPDPLFPNDYSIIVLDENNEYLRVFLNQEEQWLFPDDSKEVPDRLKTAVIYFEDKRFEKHNGIDIAALSRALYQNIKNREKISGASTITMQLARIIRPKERTIKNKIIEMMQALRIELKYSKDEILKNYLLHALQTIKRQGINNAALLVTETSSGEIKAYAGS